MLRVIYDINEYLIVMYVKSSMLLWVHFVNIRYPNNVVRVNVITNLYVPIAKIADSNIRQYLPKPKWFCVDKEMLQKYQYELDQQLGFYSTE